MRDRTKDQRRGSKLLVQFSFFLMLAGALFFTSAWATNAATQWVSDPGTCNMTDPTSFPGQNCDPVKICGDNAGIAQCYNTATLLPPAVSATSNTLYSASYPNGGYLTNCYATMDSAAPYCDNNQSFWCNRSTTCYTTQARDTVCTANTWNTSTCGSCRTGYGDCNLDGGVCEIQYGVTNYPTGANNNYLNCTTAQCDTGYLDCDAGGIDVGNGCEIQNGSTCTLGGLTGTWSGCTCLVAKQYFETGTQAQYATTDPLLWGVQFGAGPLIQFGNSGAYDLFVVNNDGSVWLNEIIPPVDPTGSLYNVGGDLYWNGAMVGSGGGSGGGWVDDGTVVRLETATDYVGIGTNTPHAKLDIGEGTLSTPSGDTSILLTHDGGDTFLETASTDMAEGLIMHSSVGGPAYDYGVVRQIASTGYANGWERGLHIYTGDNNEGSPDPIMFSIEGTERMRITDNGNVGIGTTTPSVRLAVDSGTNGEIASFRNGDARFVFGADLYGGEAGLYDGSTGELIAGQYLGNPNLVMLGQYAMYINQTSKNVGIGTDSPFTPLQVRSTSGLNTYFQMDDNSRGGVYIGNGGMYSGDEAGLYDVGGDFPLAVYDASNDTVKLGHYITVDVNSGYVGMWESSPSAQLEITDNTSASFEPLLLLSHGAAGQSVGLVPVGANPDGVVTSPRGSLAMDYNNGMLYINRDGVTDWQSLMVGTSIWDGDTDTGIEVEETLDEDYLRFYTGGNERMRITNQGNIQMGQGGHLAATLSVNGMPGQAIAGFRDADGEDIFSAIGRLSTNNFEFIIGDTTGIYPNSYGGSTGISLNQASESITFGRSQIRFQEGGGGDYVGFLAPASITTPVIWTLPATDGTAGQVLSTNGAGILSWASGGVGGAQTLQDVADYTIASDGYVAADFGAAYFEDDGGGAKWEAQAGGYQMAIAMSGATYLNFISDNGANHSGQVEFMDSRPLGDRRGIEYLADYSVDFTDRSLVDKGYVDSAVVSRSGWTDDGTAVRLTTVTDFVGIGDATPSYKLDVNSGSDGNIASFRNGDAAFLFGADLYGGEAGLYDANTGELIAGQQMGNPNLVMLGQYAMYINQTSKNVGVGTAAPDRLFHVENLDAVTNAITYAERLTHTSSGVVAAGFGTGIEFELENATNTNRIGGSIANVWGNATNAAEDGEMVFRTMLNGTLTEAMRIDDGGNLGVGTSNPAGYKLYVQGASMVDAGENTNAFMVYNGPNDNRQIRVDGDMNSVLLSEDNGYVGIGLSAPTQLLHMSSPATAASMLLTDEVNQIGIQVGYDAGGGSYLEGDYFGNDRSFTIKSNSGYKWGFFGVDGMAGIGQSADDLGYAINVDDAGKVGIGTNAPNRLLHTETLDAVTNAVTYNSRLTHFSSGVATAGFGTGMEFELENNINVSKIAGAIESKWFSAVTAEEFSSMAFKTMVDGVLTDSLYIGENGNLGIGTSNVGDRLVVNSSPQTSSSFIRINSYLGDAYHIGFDEGYGIFDYNHTGTGSDLEFMSYGNDVMMLNDDGSVAIGGGSDPVGPMLTIMGSTATGDAPILKFMTNDPTIQSEIYFSQTGNSTYWDINSSGDGGGLILMNATEEMAKFAGNGIVFNEGGLGTLDFRMEADTNINALFIDSTGTGSIGIGTGVPDRAFHVEVADGITNAVTYNERLTHTSAGTVTTGFGTGLEFELENGSNINKIAGTIESIWGSATNNAEGGEMVFKTMTAGSVYEAMRIDNYGGLVIGTTDSEGYKLKVEGHVLFNSPESPGAFVVNSDITGNNQIRVDGEDDNVILSESSGNVGIGIGAPTGKLHIYNGSALNGSLLSFGSDAGLNQIMWGDGSTMVWDINRGANNGALYIENNGSSLIQITTNTGLPAFTVAATSRTVGVFNRQTTDGVIISLQQDSVQEGTISVSGTTVSYNAFTGSHYTWHEGTIEKGTLVSMTGQNKHLNDNEKSEVLYGVEVTKQINSPKVLGSYLSILEPEQALSNTNPALVMAVGNGEVWVADKGANIEAGDYLISSDVAGHAQKMNSDFALNYVVARAAEDIDWSTVTETSADGVKHKMITVFFDSLVVNTQMVDVIKSNQMLGSKLNLAKMDVADANKIKKQLGGEMKVGSSASSSAMQVGQATIPGKRSSVDVTFDQSYDNAPIVMLTLASDSSLMRYFVSNVTSTGFRLNLYPTQYQDTLFNWQAYPSSNVQTSNSEEEEILEDLPEYQVEQDLIVIPPVEEEPVIEEEPTVIEEAAATGLEILVEGDASPVAEETVVEEESLNLEGAEDVLYNDSLSIVEVGDELGEQISETPAEPEAPAEVPVSPEISETPAEILE